ncbi:transmembrane protease serine 5 isoform X2 [Podarcis raffonei]|uniref:transmembrane protease serine 5 isoform X2 n=1 Tax=Podarcis raffonei TaxID=65483 RepID=UPI0023292BA6|nr:transmembrane protease serine 5 isoform X2 [Podarcis raffonei]
MVQSHNPGPSSEAKGEERSRTSEGNVPSKTFLANSCTAQRCLLFLGSFGLLIGTTIGVWFLVKQLQKPLPLQGSFPLQDPEAALTRCRETMEEGEKDQDTLAGDAGSKKVFFRINRSNFLLEVQAEGQSNWFLVCHENWDVSLGMQICRWLGHARLTHHKGVNLTDVKLNTTQEFAQILPNWKRNINDKWQRRSRCPSGRIVALKCSECISKAPQAMERKDPSPGHWPWQVTLYHEANHFCAGSMVSQEWIVTAAHCMHKLSGWVAFAGLEDHTSVKEQVEVAVEKAVPHPNYSSRSPNYDIAMLKLKEPLRFSDTVGAVCLPQYHQDIPSGSTCWISGQDTTRLENATGDPAETLTEVPVTLLSTQKCNSSCRMAGELSPRMLCAHYLDGNTEACKAKWGGPLVCLLEHVWRLVGIGSQSTRCKEPGQPGVYTEVAEFLDWIHHVMESY